ncbi:MAG: laccase domain-containing protein, partial [Miltoncostaeaceae bacterium]
EGPRVGAAPAGRRGLVGGVIEAVVRELAGGEGVGAAVGPAIGPCCYEVSEDVREPFIARFGPSVGRGSHLDLPGAAVAALLDAGVDAGAITVVDRCTRCNPDALFSYRGADGVCGRQCGMVWR